MRMSNEKLNFENEWSVTELKPITEEARVTYDIEKKSIPDFKKDLINKRFDKRPKNFVKYFYFIKVEEKNLDHKVILIEVPEEFPRITIMQTAIKYTVQKFDAL